ncbi:MAG: CoA transferase [Dehalococcoidia bacterium]|nr:CoA transferase [Dehalococcoidia bacterium]
MTDRALEGLRVIEFTDEIGPYAGRLLADLGAEVIKVEPPGGGRLRHLPPHYHGKETPDTSIAFWVLNTSKKSVVLDLDTPEGQARAKRLILSADAVIEDNPVGWMAARGLGYSQLSTEKPSLVYTSVTGFGQTGPHSGYAYDDIVGQAMGAIMTLAGEPTDPPFQIYGNQANASASIEAAQGTLLALLSASQTGEGQYVDVSAQEALSISQETAMQTWDLQKRNRTRTGERGMIPIALPATGVYETTDGHILSFVLAPAGEEFPALVDWMRDRGMAGDMDDEPYRSIASELNMSYITRVMSDPGQAAQVGNVVAAMAHMNDLVKAFFATLSSVEAYEEGQRRRLLIGIVSTPKTLAENTQLRARDWFQKLDFPDLGVTLEFPGAPYRLSETPVQIGRPPRLGEHTDAILGALTA